MRGQQRARAPVNADDGPVVAREVISYIREISGTSIPRTRRLRTYCMVSHLHVDRVRER